jgi:hypothetical protein
MFSMRPYVTVDSTHEMDYTSFYEWNISGVKNVVVLLIYLITTLTESVEEPVHLNKENKICMHHP